MLRIQMQSVKKKEQAEKKRLEDLRSEAQAKESLLNKTLEEKKQELDRLQQEFAQMKQRDEDSKQTEEIMKHLKVGAGLSMCGVVWCGIAIPALTSCCHPDE